MIVCSVWGTLPMKLFRNNISRNVDASLQKIHELVGSRTEQ